MLNMVCIILYVLLVEVSSHLLNDGADFYFLPPSDDPTAGLEITGNCSKCPPGWGVKKPCTPRTATECERCVTGDTYSSKYSNTRGCWICSRCGTGLYEARRCSRKRDTVCDDCLRVINKPEIENNRDFRRKCGYLLLGKNRLKIG